MSVYDFNSHEQHLNNANHASNHGTSNGNNQLARYNQIESNFLSRNLSATNHHHNSDMSVALTRPTSKTAMFIRQRRAMLEQLSCFLCKGYLIDATTIDECMDSFCKSCIVKYLHNRNNCPKCGTMIHKVNPLEAIKSDKVLQDIVYKLVPGLYDREMKRRRDFYRGIYGASISTDEDDSSSESSNEIHGLRGEKYGIVPHPKPFYKPTDNIDLSIEPQTGSGSSTVYYDTKRQSVFTCFTGNHQRQSANMSAFLVVDSQQFTTYLRCPAKFNVLQLKKFIAAKFNISCDDTIHLLYINESLKDEYSLIDVAYIYDWRGIEHMRLYYIIERDLSRTNQISDHSQVEQQRTTGKSRQSIGMSTQTAKRVCIDPEPRFYSVEQNNNTIIANTKGRSTRSRNPESKFSSINSLPTRNTQVPILRSSSGTVSSSGSLELNRSTNMNGISNRELVALNTVHNTGPQPTAHRSTVSMAMEELSRLDTRSSRRQTVERSATRTIPKANAIPYRDEVGCASRNPGKAVTDHRQTYPDARLDRQKQSSVNRLVEPQDGKSYLENIGFAGPSQSSLVTLANFTDVQSNYAMATVSASTTTAATISNSYRNMIGAGTQALRPDMRPDESLKRDQSQPQTTRASNQPVPQLAFSFVTERGITIVRRLNNQTDNPQKLTSGPNSSATRLSQPGSNSVPALPHSSMPQGGGLVQQSARSQSMSSSQFQSGGSQSNSLSSPKATPSSGTYQTGQEASGSRHHFKAKPVYKTLVDPTKVKSPNLKKLNYTARH